MKKGRFIIFDPLSGDAVFFSTLKEIREYVSLNQSDYTDYRCRHVFNSNGERVYIIRVRLHPFYGYVEHVTLSSRI